MFRRSVGVSPGRFRRLPRAERKFGVMPIYTTAEGQHHPLLSAFHDRLFAFEHRNWEAIDLDEAKLRGLGGKVLARESRDGVSKGYHLPGIGPDDAQMLATGTLEK